MPLNFVLRITNTISTRKIICVIVSFIFSFIFVQVFASIIIICMYAYLLELPDSRTMATQVIAERALEDEIAAFYGKTTFQAGLLIGLVWLFFHQAYSISDFCRKNSRFCASANPSE